MPLQSPIFPIDQPVMPEERQIGRRAAIDALEHRIGSAVHQWLIGPRRIGKTSVAKAVLARLRATSAIALDVDLSKLDISTTEALAGELARQAQAAGVGASTRERWSKLAGSQAKTAAVLGRAIRELGFDDEAQALAAVSSLLAGADGGEPGLRRVLEALALHARATGRHVVVLLDEVQRLADLDAGEHDVARWARESESPVVFVFAGSEESAVRALREHGRPLAPVGQEFHLATISGADWMDGLRRRFAEAHVTIGDAEIYAITEASANHPRRTMLIANYVRTATSGDGKAGGMAVSLAIAEARKDRSWA